MEWILGGIVFGFLGSFHCLGMCGPLALALPGSNRSWGYLIISRLIYNFGRIITLSILGVAVGLLSNMITLGNLRGSLSIGVGLLILAGVFISSFRRKLEQWKAYPSRLLRKASSPIKLLFKKGNLGSLFLIGLLNALLPCGFIYLALTTALATGTVLKSFTFMIGFGLGTVPAMFAASISPGFIPVSMRRKMQKISPYFIALVGILLILRGLNLGIMFISPKLFGSSGCSIF